MSYLIQFNVCMPATILQNEFNDKELFVFSFIHTMYKIIMV